MSDAAEPRWELLPHDPQQFFELPDGYDLGELKRSYNRLIRRFKPEKFPDEFQRIRAAYESLNGALRYNITLRPTPAPRSQPTRNEPEPSQPTTPEDTPADPINDDAESPGTEALTPPIAETTVSPQPVAESDQAETVDDIVRATLVPPPVEEAPHATYARLKYLEVKSADDYITLALLADVVHPHAVAGHAESFLDWLYAGLADHPRNWKLTSLLRQYLADEHDVQMIAALLVRTVDVLPHDRFQFVTEQAWDRLLREASFEDFRECLDRCGEHLGRAIDRTQLVFYVHILKFAIWKADAEFLDGIFGTVEDHYHELDRYAQGEFEMLALLRDYMAERQAFVARGPCCARIDQAMRDWCMLSEAAGDLSVLDCQYFINHRGKRLCDEFPDPSADLSAMLLAWDRIVGDVLERLDEPPPVDMKEIASRAFDFLVRHSRRLSRTWRNNVNTLAALGAIALFLVAAVATIALVVRSFMYFYEARWLAGLLDWVYAAAALTAGTVVPWKMINHSERSFVYAHVRPDLISLFRVGALTVPAMAALVERQEKRKYGDQDKIRGTAIIAAGMRGDAALQLFSLAQICLRAAEVEPQGAPLILL